MPVNVRLSDDKRYLVYSLEEPMQMQELMEAYADEKALRDSIEYTLHSIVDMSNLRGIPANWLTAKAGPGLTHPRSGRILFVGISFGLQIIVQTILKIARYDRMVFFSTREEADAYMAQLVKETKEQETAASSAS